MRVCTYNKKLEMIGAIIDESSVTNRGVGKHLASFVPHCNSGSNTGSGSHLIRFLREIRDFSCSTNARLQDSNQIIQNPLNWLKQIERLKELGGVTDKEVLIVARDHLVGKAAAWFDVACSQVNTWSEFSTLFKKRFCIALEDYCWNQIYNLRQAEHEDVDDIDVRLRELFSLVGLTNEKLKIRLFLSAVDPVVACEVERNKTADKFKDLDSVVDAAAHAETVVRKYRTKDVFFPGPPVVNLSRNVSKKYQEQDWHSEDNQSVNTASTMEELLKEFKELKVSIVQSVGASNGASGGRNFRPFSCFYCKKEGHRKAECPEFLQKKKDAPKPPSVETNGANSSGKEEGPWRSPISQILYNQTKTILFNTLVLCLQWRYSG
ncbi:unnamed protein product [Rhizopus microsporus]